MTEPGHCINSSLSNAGMLLQRRIFCTIHKLTWQMHRVAPAKCSRPGIGLTFGIERSVYCYTSNQSCTACCRAENSTSGGGSSTCSLLDKGMQTIQESLQAEYDELYEHYQVSCTAF